MIVPALGMADNDGAGLRIRQHLGGNIAGMRAGRLRVAILSADGDAAAAGPRGEAGNEQKRRTDQDIDMGRAAWPSRR